MRNTDSLSQLVSPSNGVLLKLLNGTNLSLHLVYFILSHFIISFIFTFYYLSPPNCSIYFYLYFNEHALTHVDMGLNLSQI